VTFHSLRHTAAALMLDGSAGDLRMVMSVLGHSNVSTTVDLYGGLAESSRQRAATIIEKMLEGSDESVS
jgi:integrase